MEKTVGAGILLLGALAGCDFGQFEFVADSGPDDRSGDAFTTTPMPGAGVEHGASSGQGLDAGVDGASTPPGAGVEDAGGSGQGPATRAEDAATDASPVSEASCFVGPLPELLQDCRIHACDAEGNRVVTPDDSRCGGDTPSCQLETGECGCSSDEDCSAAGLPFCDAESGESGRCVECDDERPCERPNNDCLDALCVNGACEERIPVASRACGEEVCEPLSECDALDACSLTGTRDFSCTAFACASGACEDSTRTEARDCTRNTDADSCDDGQSCTENDQCSEGRCQGTPVDSCEEPPACGSVVQVAAGSSHSCVLFSGGCIRCWGSGAGGKLGYGSTANVGDRVGLSVAEVGNVDLGAGVTAMQVVATGGHTCALLSEGEVRCWGSGGSGRLGYGNTENVGDGFGLSVAEVGNVDLGAGVTATHLAVGGGHTCALLSGGEVRCWGGGASGKLGYGNTGNVGDGVGLSVAEVGNVDFGAGATAVQLIAGANHTCALLSDGGVRCWGLGRDGQLGYGNTENVGDGFGLSVAEVGNVDLGAGATAVQLVAGGGQTCALLAGGGVRCWGDAEGVDAGPLGYGNTDNVGDGVGLSVAEVGDLDFGAGATAVQAVAAGGMHACALLSGGGVRCWGDGQYGKLGYGNTENVGDGLGLSVAEVGNVDFGPGATVVQVAVGIGHACALLSGGGVRCWGRGGLGRLGYGNTANVGDGGGPSLAEAGDVQFF